MKVFDTAKQKVTFTELHCSVLGLKSLGCVVAPTLSLFLAVRDKMVSLIKGFPRGKGLGAWGTMFTPTDGSTELDDLLIILVTFHN